MSEQFTPNIGLDLRRIHRVITRGLAVLQEQGPQLAERGFPDDTARDGFWKYCRCLEATLDWHHLTEDDVFFPFVRSRLPGTDFRALHAQHEHMLVVLGEMRAAREAGSISGLLPALARLAAVWHPHIAREEAWFSPEIMARVMTPDEHADMARKASAHNAAHAQPAQLAVPFLLYNVEGQDRDFFLRVMPAELTQQLVPIAWKDEWAAMMPFLLPV